MSPNERKAQIYQRLTLAFDPLSLEVIDDSAHHIGHSGHGGAGHFTVKITAAVFAGQSLLSQHRMIYNVLQELIGPEIHALQIDSCGPPRSADPLEPQK